MEEIGNRQTYWSKIQGGDPEQTIKQPNKRTANSNHSMIPLITNLGLFILAEWLKVGWSRILKSNPNTLSKKIAFLSRISLFGS